MNTKTYSTYQTAPTGDPNARWTTVISDVLTGHAYQVKFTATEQEGWTWAESLINGVPNPHGGWTMPVPEGYTIDEQALFTSEGNSNTLKMFGDDDDYVPRSAPIPDEQKPVVPVTCYCCGTKLNVQHQWNYWTDELTLDIAHCGKQETKRFTLTQAKELAKVGWMAFLN